MLKDFKQRVEVLAKKRRPKVMIGLYQGRHNEAIAESVRRVQREIADVVVVGLAVGGVYESISDGPAMGAIY